MTATHVNGVEVIADEPTTSPITAKDGSPVLWHQTRTLLLADGSTVYGCVHCDYTSPNANSVRPHLNRHRNNSSASKSTPGDLSLNELVARLADLDKVTADRDEWKRRALAAEKRLKALRNALGVSSG